MTRLLAELNQTVHDKPPVWLVPERATNTTECGLETCIGVAPLGLQSTCYAPDTTDQL